MKKIFNTILVLAAAIIVAHGFATGGLRFAEAHTPCDYEYKPPVRCHHVQVVDPYTGKLETEYVCE